MGDNRPHRQLLAWQRSIDLASTVYTATSAFPKEEIYALTSQMRRSAVSIASNIAEGAARGSRKEFAHFLGIARGSLSELDTQLVIAQEIGYLSDAQSLEENINHVFKLLNGLITKVKADASTQ